MSILAIFIVVISLSFVVLRTCVADDFRKLSGLAKFLILGGAITTVRWSALFFLTYLEWTKQQTLSALPLVFLVVPEGALFSSSQVLTVGGVILYACALAAGSFLLAAVVVGLSALQRKLLAPRRKDSVANADD